MPTWLLSHHSEHPVCKRAVSQVCVIVHRMYKRAKWALVAGALWYRGGTCRNWEHRCVQISFIMGASSWSVELLCSSCLSPSTPWVTLWTNVKLEKLSLPCIKLSELSLWAEWSLGLAFLGKQPRIVVSSCLENTVYPDEKRRQRRAATCWLHGPLGWGMSAHPWGRTPLILCPAPDWGFGTLRWVSKSFCLERQHWAVQQTYKALQKYF